MSLPVFAGMASEADGLLQLPFHHAAMPSAIAGTRMEINFFDSKGEAFGAMSSLT